MRKTIGLALAIMMGFSLLVSGVCLAASKKTSGFLGEYYKNLQPGPKDGVKLRWMKPGVSYTKYNKLMFDSIVLFRP